MLEIMPEESFRLAAFAKINLFLRILGKRSDNYHELCTIFQTVLLKDFLTFSLADEIVLTCDATEIPLDETNLVTKAARLLQSKYDVKKGAEINLEKNIPAPGGLGGGSSNAAVALLGLSKLWNLKINFAELCEIGATLGADVPFFFYGGTALGSGRGTEIFPLTDFGAKHLLIVTPKVSVSTKVAFARLNAPNLTDFDSKGILKICRNEAETAYLQQSKLENGFEKTIFEVEPEIAQVKKELLESGASSALLSGSGASVFAIFDTNEQRQNALSELRSARDWRIFPTGTVSRADYQKSLDFEKHFV